MCIALGRAPFFFSFQELPPPAPYGHFGRRVPLDGLIRLRRRRASVSCQTTDQETGMPPSLTTRTKHALNDDQPFYHDWFQASRVRLAERWAPRDAPSGILAGTTNCRIHHG